MNYHHYVLTVCALAGASLALNCGDDDDAPAEVDPCEELADVCLDCSVMTTATECSQVAVADDHEACETGLVTYAELCDPCTDVEALCANCPDTTTQTACQAVAAADDHEACEEELPDFQTECAAAE